MTVKADSFSRMLKRAHKLHVDGRHQDAREYCDNLLKRYSKYPTLRFLSAVVDLAIGNYEAATAVLERICREHPAFADGWEQLGECFKKQMRWELSAMCYRRVMALAPERIGALSKCAVVRSAQGDVQEAISLFEAAAGMNHKHDADRYNRAYARLTLGAYTQGFEDNEARMPADLVPVGKKGRAHARYWDGSHVPGTVVLLEEQGVGDTLMMLRYLPLLKGRSEHFALMVRPELVPLLDGQWPHVEVIPTTTEALEHRACLQVMSLPHLIPGGPLEGKPFLKKPAIHPLPPKRQPVRLAFCWKGNPIQGDDVTRSINLDTWRPLLEMPGVEWVSVQVPATVKERQLMLELGIRNAGADCLDFAQTAGVMAACDGVVSVDTSVAHLAGALGCPTILLKSAIPDWRWGMVQEVSTWYGSIRILRQQVAMQWDGVMAAVGALVNHTLRLAAAGARR